MLPVLLNIYRIKEDSFLDSLGIKIYHSAIEYDNLEYAFGYLDDDSVSGIYDIKSLSYDDGMFVESIKLGNLSRRQFFQHLEKIKNKFIANTYNIITKNCNHFTNEFMKTVMNKEMPDRYKSFLQIGEFIGKIMNIWDR